MIRQNYFELKGIKDLEGGVGDIDFSTINEFHFNELSEVHNLFEYLSENDLNKLHKLLEIVSSEINDQEFGQRISDFINQNEKIFSGLSNLPQHDVHGGYDPLEHTLNMLQKLETKDLNNDEVIITRIASVFHDIGKLIDSLSKKHPLYSKFLSEFIMPYITLNKEIQQRILLHIQFHDVLGEIARKDGRNDIDINDALKVFDNISDLKIAKTIALADISSIPGLSKYKNQIESVVILYEKHLRAKEIFIEPQNKEEDEKFDIELLNKYFEIQKLIERNVNDELGYLRGFDDVDIQEEQKESRKRFESLTQEQKNILLDSIIMFSSHNDFTTSFNKEDIEYNLLLSSLKLTGRETDRAFVLELEKRAGKSLENVRVAIELFDLTYKMWSLSNWIKPYYAESDYTIDYDNSNHLSPFGHEEPVLVEKRNREYVVPYLDGVEYNDFLRYLKEIKKNAHFLASHKVEVTHSTSPTNYQKIVKDGYLIKSSTLLDKHFEGDGVYAGMLGSYRAWFEKTSFNDESKEESESDTLLTFKIPLAQTIPIIVSYLTPKAMCNILTDKLHLKKYELDSADGFEVFCSDSQWWKEEFDGELTEWKINILKDSLACDVVVVKDEFNKDMVVLDTKEPPIVWGAISRTLRLRRVVPVHIIENISLPQPIIREIKQKMNSQILYPVYTEGRSFNCLGDYLPKINL